MGYQMWCEAVRSSILATAWLLVFIFLLFLMCHYAVMLCPRGQCGLEAKSLFSASASKRLFRISGPLEPSLYLHRFLEMGPRHIAISDLVEKGYYNFQRGAPT